jgi:hypothetical protein
VSAEWFESAGLGAMGYGLGILMVQV